MSCFSILFIKIFINIFSPIHFVAQKLIFFFLSEKKVFYQCFFSSTFRNIENFLFCFALEIGFFEFFKKDKKTWKKKINSAKKNFRSWKIGFFEKKNRIIRKKTVSYWIALNKKWLLKFYQTLGKFGFV